MALGSCLSHLEGHVVVLPEPAHPVSRHIQDSIGWVQALAAEPDVQQVLTSDTLQSHKDLKQDHLVRSTAWELLQSACRITGALTVSCQLAVLRFAAP